MRIMEIVSGAGMNGAIQHCLLLSRELARRGNAVTVVCHPESWIARQLAADPVEQVASDLHRWPPDELRRVARIVRERGIEVMHTHMSRAHFFGVLLRWLTGIPSVATAHSRLIQLHWMFNDLVIAVSEATRRYHCSHNLVRPRRTVTIPNFIDDRRVARVPADARARVRASLGIGDDCLLAGAVGAATPRKGLLYLVRALPAILAAVPQARLAIVGGAVDAAYVAAVQAEAARLGVDSKILWTGHRDDVDHFMAAMDLCVLASLEEGFPLTILEAMAAGLPVVATAVGGVPECVVPGQTGLLVPPADPGALAEAIVELLRDPARCRRLGCAGRDRVRNHFSTDGQVAAIEAAVRRVASRRRAA